VLVTHEPEIARHTQRIIHIRDGRISRDEMVLDPLQASDVLAGLPTDDEEEQP
jgi:putative ABC transport system ATP-binding protein